MEIADIERVIYGLASLTYRDYPEPMPAFSILGEEGQRMLESAIAEPQQSFDGQFLHPDICHQAAALMRSLIKNHPFQDGNKRMGLTATVVFLLINRYALFASQQERVDFALEIAKSNPIMSVDDIAAWLQEHSKPFEEVVINSGGSAEEIEDLQSDFRELMELLETLTTE